MHSICICITMKAEGILWQDTCQPSRILTPPVPVPFMEVQQEGSRGALI